MKPSGADSAIRTAQTVVTVVLAAALGVTVSLLMDARRRIDALERARAPHTAQHVPPDLRDLEARVSALEDRLDAPSGAAAGGASRPALAGAAQPPADAPDERRAQLQALVKQELQQAEQQRDEARSERARARVVERVDALAAAARLTAEQKQKLTAMLDAEQQEIRQLFRDARDGGDLSGVREQVRALRQSTDENARAVLDAEQLKAWTAMREEERSRFLGALGLGARDIP